LDFRNQHVVQFDTRGLFARALVGPGEQCAEREFVQRRVRYA
jgi:hypothetical protein